MARLPAQLGAGALVDVDAVDRGEHLPAAPRVLRLVVGEAPHDRGRVLGPARQVARGVNGVVALMM